MAEENDTGTAIEGASVEPSDTAAMNAVTDFFADGDRAKTAEKEAGESSPDLNAAIKNRDHAEQEQELVDEGIVDADGNAIEPEEKTDEVVETETAKPATKGAKGETPATTVKLDPILHEAAIEAGYSPAQIERLFKADPEIAEETFARLVIGPGTPRTDPAASPAASTAASANDQLKIPDFLTDAALTKFAEANGEEVANAFKALRDTLVAPMQAMQAQLAQSQRSAIAHEANTAIAELAKANVAVYGDGTDAKTSVAQQAKRYALAETADQLISGAKSQGKNLSVTEALKRAHYIVSRGSERTAARAEIVAQVKKRAAAITSKPTKRAAPKANSGEQSLAAATEVVNNFWNERGS